MKEIKIKEPIWGFKKGEIKLLDSKKADFAIERGRAELAVKSTPQKRKTKIDKEAEKRQDKSE